MNHSSRHSTDCPRSVTSSPRYPDRNPLHCRVAGPWPWPAASVRPLPVYAADADGGVIVDIDGNSFIDFGSGIAVTTRRRQQLCGRRSRRRAGRHFTHTCFMITPYEGYVAVAERLNHLTPGDHQKRTVLFNSGAEAVENAIKVARLATGRDAVVAFDHAYHGRTNLTMGLTAKTMPYKTRFRTVRAGDLPGAHVVSVPRRTRGPRRGRAAISPMEKQIGADQIAAIIIEPVMGEGGFIVPAPGFLPAIADWATANGIVFIADEVQTRFRPHRRLVRQRPRGPRPRPGHDGQGHRRRYAACPR